VLRLSPFRNLQETFQCLPQEVKKGSKVYGAAAQVYDLTDDSLSAVNRALKFVTEVLQETGHPSITAESPSKRAYAKSTATPDIKFLHKSISEFSGLGVRIANQAMAVAKQYKGKKAVSLETLKKSIDEFDVLAEGIVDNLYLYGLLPPEVATVYEQEKGLTPQPAETSTPPAEIAETPPKTWGEGFKSNAPEDTTPSVDELFPPPKGEVDTEVDVPEGALEANTSG